MQTINLKQYYPFCKEDIFVEVSDEIVEAFLLDKRAEAARDRKMFRYKAFYSLDCNDGIENAAIGWAQPSPEDYLIGKEELYTVDGSFVVLFETGRVLDGIFGFFHLFRSANNSSRSL